ncbi:pyridoxal phosphate-dependent aminotransferase [Sporolactobacillus sp. CQH2019]|uniref:MalY/PatB family protein n=1 Tax=Sporolactobacillus sp. CQH2019 TaxID=3023512 RepID=UPI0023686ADC|nr:MalY/PatB family protein [Sporolactobacillus sp. CQH2019]MDD9148521.1 pyridoxal phosphate-dependent aminotransferase [Sporolactobacillus sp. CQH2019]
MNSKEYDFDEIIERKGSASVKWDEADRIFHTEGLLPMWVADMDFRVPDEVTAALRNRVDHGIYGYSLRSESYLAAVQRWMSARHGWEIEREWICHSPGVVTALNLIVDGFTEPGDKVLIQPPVYPPFRKSARNQARDLVTNPLVYDQGKYTMDFADLERKMSDPSVKMMILCSPHNPVGRVWTKAELSQVSQLSLKHHVLVVCDEIHGDLVFSGKKQIPFAGLSEEAASHSIICTAPSKTFNIAGLQISNIIIPDPALRRIYLDQLQRFSLNEPNALGAVAAEAAYRGGGEWLDQCLDYIKRNADYVADFLRSRIPELTMVPLEGTYLGWIDCRKLGLDKIQLQNLMLKKAKIAFNQGYTFGDEGGGFVRVNLACPRSLIKQAMGRMLQAIQNL